MSISRLGQKNEFANQFEFVAVSPPKVTKIDITSKLQVIQALDNGRTMEDIAKEYGIHPQTVADIHVQRNSIIKKYTEKYNILKQICSLNLDQNLIHWFEQQFTNGQVITEQKLRDKTMEILKPLAEEFSNIDEWLYSFQRRYNISKCINEDKANEKLKVEWKNFLKSVDNKDIYLGGVCALAHDFDLTNYLKGQDTENYLSLLFIVNTLGTDKREIVVASKESLESEANVKSLNVSYYFCGDSKVNYSVINDYLTKWDSELSSKGKCITLVLNVPNYIKNKQNFENIKIVNTSDLNYVTHILDNMETCLKYYYRKLQIIKRLIGKESPNYLDYIHLIGNAWYNVPYKYIQNVCLPAERGSLYFDRKEEIENGHSLSCWCKTSHLPLNIDYCPTTLDKYIICDKGLPCIYSDDTSENVQAVEVLKERNPQPNPGIEAYQAMKRLVSYIQSESGQLMNGGETIIKYAKYLENHTEYGALLEMHQIISSTNPN